MSEINKLEGKFGRLEIIKFDRILGQKAKWICRCDCGKIKSILGYQLTNGRTKSCGCLRKDRVYNRLWKGCGELSGSLFNNIRARAKKRNMEFNLTTEYLWNLYCQQDRKCALSGLPISFSKTWSSDRKKRNMITTASLDRIDSSKGYVIGNVQWVHQDLNTMKMDIPQDEFIKICKLVANKFKEQIMS